MAWPRVSLRKRSFSSLSLFSTLLRWISCTKCRLICFFRFRNSSDITWMERYWSSWRRSYSKFPATCADPSGYSTHREQTSILSFSMYDNSSNDSQMSPRVLQSRNFSSKSSENDVWWDAGGRVDVLGAWETLNADGTEIFKSKSDSLLMIKSSFWSTCDDACGVVLVLWTIWDATSEDDSILASRGNYPWTPISIGVHELSPREWLWRHIQIKRKHTVMT